AGASLVSVTWPQMSDAWAWASQAWTRGSLAGMPAGPVHSRVSGAGTVRLGAVGSATVTLGEGRVVLAQESAGANSTLVACPGAQPAGKRGGALLAMVTALQTSLPAAWASQDWMRGSLCGTPPWALHSRASGAGTVSAGGVESVTVAFWL